MLSAVAVLIGAPIIWGSIQIMQSTSAGCFFIGRANGRQTRIVSRVVAAPNAIPTNREGVGISPWVPQMSSPIKLLVASAMTAQEVSMLLITTSIATFEVLFGRLQHIFI